MTEHPTAAESLAVGRELLAAADRAAGKYISGEIAAEWATLAGAHFLAAIATKLVES